MERLDLIYRGAVAFGGATIAYLFGGWSALLGILLAFVVLDYLTGLMAAAIRGELSSLVGMRGIAKKVCIFVMVAIAHLVDKALGGTSLVQDATIFFYLANELISIIENSGRIGIPVPDPIQKAVLVLKRKSGGGINA